MVTIDDLGFIAALELNGIPPQETAFERYRFVGKFEDTPELQRLRAEYFSGRLRGPLYAFNSRILALSTQLREARRMAATASNTGGAL